MATVPDGTYRFQCFADNEGEDFFTLKSTGQVKADSLDEDSDTQKWKATKRSDGHYDIANAGTDALLAVASPTASETAYTLSVKGDNATSWDFDRSGNKIVLKATGQFTGKSADLSERDRVILWETNSLPNQRWILEFIALPPPKVQPTWVAVQGTNIPPNAIVGGHEDDEPTLYVARAAIKGSVHPGKAGKQLPGNCRVTWGSQEFASSNYEVLVASPGTYKWVPLPDGPENQIDLSSVQRMIVGGRNVDMNVALYPLRAPYNGALIPGAGRNGGFSLGLNGVRVTSPTTGREVLCYAD